MIPIAVYIALSFGVAIVAAVFHLAAEAHELRQARRDLLATTPAGEVFPCGKNGDPR